MSNSGEDTEIMISTGKLLMIFFGLVVVCAVFFSAGYSLGKTTAKAPAVTSDPSLSATANGSAAGTGHPNGDATAASADLNFYKAVESKDPNPQPKPEAESAPAPAPEVTPAKAATTEPVASAPPPAPVAVTGGYFVQVAAVTKPEDAEALVGALKKKQYAAFAANNAAADKFFHVQIGPFPNVKEAEATRAQLMKDGYTPILKR